MEKILIIFHLFILPHLSAVYWSIERTPRANKPKQVESRVFHKFVFRCVEACEYTMTSIREAATANRCDGSQSAKCVPKAVIEAQIVHYHLISWSVQSNSQSAESKVENVENFIMKCVILSVASVLLPLLVITYGQPTDNIKFINENGQLINIKGEVVTPSK